MKKGWVAGAIVMGLGATGYLAGVYFSGKQVDQFVEQSLAAARHQVADQGEVILKAERGFFASTYDVQYRVEGLTPEIEALLGGKDIPLALQVNHGFLAANSTLILAQSPLLEQLRETQVNSDREPFQLEIQQRFNPLSQAVEIKGTFVSDSFHFENQGQGVADIGASNIAFEQIGRDFKVDLSMADSELRDAQFTLRFEGIQAHEKGRMDHEDLFQSVMAETMQGELSIDRILSSTDIYSAELQKLSITLSQLVEKSRLISRLGYQAAELSVKDLTQDGVLQVVSEPRLQMMFDLDYQTSRELLAMMRQMEPSDQADQQALVELLGAADKVSEQGVAVEVTDLSFGWQGEKAKGEAFLTLAPFAVSQVMANPALLQSKMALDAGIELPVNMLKALPDYNPQQIESLKALGFITEDGSFYKVKLHVKDGKAELNDQPLPM